jgi:hypothetical protein
LPFDFSEQRLPRFTQLTLELPLLLEERFDNLAVGQWEFYRATRRLKLPPSAPSAEFQNFAECLLHVFELLERKLAHASIQTLF